MVPYVKLLVDGLGLNAVDAHNLLFPHAARVKRTGHVDLSGVTFVTTRTDVNINLVSNGEDKTASGPRDTRAKGGDLGETLETDELEAHERVDRAGNQRLDGVVVGRSDLSRAKQGVDLRGRNSHVEELHIVVELVALGQQEASAAKFGDGEVGVGSDTGLNVVASNFEGGVEHDLGCTGLTGISNTEGSLDDGVIHLTAECENRILRVGGRGVGKHTELVFLVDEVSPVEVAKTDAATIMRSGDERGVLVAAGYFDGVNGTDAIVEVELSILGLDAHVRAQAGTFLLELDFDVALVGVYESCINLKRHVRSCE